MTSYMWKLNSRSLTTHSWTVHRPGTNEWMCEGCFLTFNVIDELPHEVVTIERLDVTTFGSTQKTHFLQERRRVYCSACKP
jgi:hypothetical protein